MFGGIMLNYSSLICADENAAVAGWIESSFPIIKIVVMCLIAFLSIVMIVLSLMQKSDTNGVSAISGHSDTFYNRNKGATLQGKVKILTIIDAVLILVLSMAYLVLNTIFEGFI